MFYYGWILCYMVPGSQWRAGPGQGAHNVGDGSEVSTYTHVHTWA